MALSKRGTDEDIAAVRTYGEAEVRAELAAADTDYATRKHGQRRGSLATLRTVVIVVS